MILTPEFSRAIHHWVRVNNFPFFFVVFSQSSTFSHRHRHRVIRVIHRAIAKRLWTTNNTRPVDDSDGVQTNIMFKLQQCCLVSFVFLFHSVSFFSTRILFYHSCYYSAHCWSGSILNGWHHHCHALWIVLARTITVVYQGIFCWLLRRVAALGQQHSNNNKWTNRSNRVVGKLVRYDDGAVDSDGLRFVFLLLYILFAVLRKTTTTPKITKKTYKKEEKYGKKWVCLSLPCRVLCPSR